MSTNDTDSPNTDDPPGTHDPVDHVVALSTEDDQIVVYDEQQPTAWIQSTHSVPIGEVR